MAQYDNGDTYVVFPNKKAQNPNAPSHTGTMTVSPETVRWLQQQLDEGKEAKMRLAQWSKQSPRVEGEFFSGKLEPERPRELQGASRSGHQVVNTPAPNIDDEIPF